MEINLQHINGGSSLSPGILSPLTLKSAVSDSAVIENGSKAPKPDKATMRYFLIGAT